MSEGDEGSRTCGKVPCLSKRATCVARLALVLADHQVHELLPAKAPPPPGVGSVVGRQAASWPDLLTLQRLGPVQPWPQQLQAGQGPAPGPLASEFPWDVLALMVKSVSLFSVPVCPRGLKMSPHSIPLLSSHLPFRLGRVANWVYCLNTPSI